MTDGANPAPPAFNDPHDPAFLRAPSPRVPDAGVPWSALGLSETLLRAIENRGYKTPTPVQAAAIPKALPGRDLLVRSKTGTGKTAAFLLPVLDRVPAGYGRPYCLVLCPTRELALQIAEEAALLTAGSPLRVATLYGGVSIGPQIDQLKAGAEIVVGTPGRVKDHVQRGSLKLGDARVGVLDEADEMLSMGFYEEVTELLSRLPKDAQILLFSATVEERLKELIGRFLKDPEEIYLSVDSDRLAEGIRHFLYETTIEYPKPRQLLHILEVEDPDSAIVFCNTREDTDMVARFLNRQGLVAEPISSDLAQKARERVIQRIKRGEIDILVATDVAARGIDIQDLSHVFHYSLPEDPAVYLHRTGRTGRIGKSGTAVSLMSGRELGCRKILETKFGIHFEERKLPGREDAERLWTDRHVREILAAMGEGIAFEGFLPMAKDLRQRGEEADALIALALRGFFRWHRMEKSRRALEAQGEDPEAVERLMEARVGRGGRGGGGHGGFGGGRGGGRGGGAGRGHGGGGRGGGRGRGR
jgi:ATP-dependent RNA helicase DeaD